MSHLKLVGTPEPPKPPRRKGQRYAPLLTAEEEQRFRQTLRNLRDAFGTWTCLAAAMRMTHESIWRAAHGKESVSARMIICAMRATGLSYEQLTGEPIAADRCRACGQLRRAS